MRKTPFVLLLVFMTISCSTVPPGEKAREGLATVVKPAEIHIPLAPQFEKEKKVQGEEQKQFYSFSFREADLKDVCRAISKQTNYNIVVDPDVQGVVTLDLREVMLPKALEYILEPLKYSYKIDGRTIHVSRPKLQTKMFPVNYVALKKMGTSTLSAAIGGSTSGTGGTGGTAGTGTTGTGTTTGTTGTGTTGTGGTAGQGMGILSMTSVTESDLWKNLEENLKVLLSPDGKIAVNRQGHMIFVTDYQRNVDDIAMFLQAIEGAIHRQVMIEAKIIEVHLNKESREGVNWSLLQGKIGEFTVKASQAFLNPTPTPLPTGMSGLSGQPFFRFFVGNKNIDIDKTFIDLMKTQGEINVISSPKIATLNNQRAVIKVARQDVYFVGTQSTGITQGLATYTPNFMTVGLILDVIPQIDASGNIILNIHPMLTEKIDTAKAPDNSEVPILEVREADTMVRIKEGETVVIGGLIKNLWTKDQTGVKGLSSVPFLGALFRAKEEMSQKSELVVFLTPRIIHMKDENERNP
jgi:MSHA type pilus biogenesis protein MshL